VKYDAGVWSSNDSEDPGLEVQVDMIVDPQCCLCEGAVADEDDLYLPVAHPSKEGLADYQ